MDWRKHNMPLREEKSIVKGYRIKNKQLITAPLKIAVAVVSLLMCAISCGNKNTSFGEVTTPREKQAQLSADSVSTLISDSGITKYRISTIRWLIFDKSKEPYWFFPKGLRFEKFDTVFNVDATMWADTAIFYQPRNLWEFRGNVEVSNTQDEHFSTTQFFWDNNQERFYTEKKIRIRQADKIIEGIGFESNSSLTDYTIKHPTGIFPTESEDLVGGEKDEKVD